MNNRSVAEALNQPIRIVDHIFESLESNGLIEYGKSIGGGGSHIDVFWVSPELRRSSKGTIEACLCFLQIYNQLEWVGTREIVRKEFGYWIHAVLTRAALPTIPPPRDRTLPFFKSPRTKKRPLGSRAYGLEDEGLPLAEARAGRAVPDFSHFPRAERSSG